MEDGAGIIKLSQKTNNSIVKLCQMYYFCSASNGKTNWEKHNNKPNNCKEIWPFPAFQTRLLPIVAFVVYSGC